MHQKPSQQLFQSFALLSVVDMYKVNLSAVDSSSSSSSSRISSSSILAPEDSSFFPCGHVQSKSISSTQ